MENVKENRWYYYNLDLIEESLQNNKIPVILIAGASSSGKTHYAGKLQDFLMNKNLKTCLFSTDNYNRGISEIVFNKVNENYLNHTIQNEKEIVDIIRKIIINKSFSDKFDTESQVLIKKECEKYFNKDIYKFVDSLKTEFERINFDEKSVYDLNLLAEDINNLVSNKEVKSRKYSKVISEQLDSKEIISKPDVIIVEGIFALNDDLINKINALTIKNFIDCDSKSLFLRRVLRDKSTTNCPSTYIVKSYLDYVVPAYEKFVLPSKKNADFVIDNNITFEELRNGEKNSIQKKVTIPTNKVENLLKSSIILKHEFVKDTFFGDRENVLRLRETSENNSSYKMFSLIHKGYAKYRFDKKIIRPINTLLNENELNETFSSKAELLSKFIGAGLKISEEETKERFLINYKNNLYHLDKINDKYILELDEDLIKNKTDCEKVKDSKCDEIINENEFVK